MMALVQAAVTPILAPVMTRMAEQEVTIREQAEMIGELRAENRALVAPQRRNPSSRPRGCLLPDRRRPRG